MVAPYQLGPNGLPMVGGIPLPLSPDQMAAAGQQPAAPGGIPMPQPNPLGGLPPNAVAGPGGGLPPVSEDPNIAANGAKAWDAIKGAGHWLVTPQGKPIGPGAPKEPFADPYLPPSTPAPAAEAKAPQKLIPTVAEAQQQSAPKADLGQEAAAQWAMRHAAGTGPRGLAETGETDKFTQYGTVPQALSADIDARQAAIDKAQSAQISEAYAGNAQALDRQRGIIEQEQKDAQEAEARRQAVNQRVAELQSHADTQEAALVQAKPKELSDFWKEKGDGSQMWAAIAVALGAMGQARTGGPNTGKEVVDGQINRWVNDQKQKYEAAKDQASLANNAYKSAIEMYGTPEAAESSLRLQALTASNAMAQNMADQSKNQQWLTNAQLMQQQNQLEIQKLRAAAIQQAGMKQIEAKLAMRGGEGSGKNPYLAGAQAAAEYRTAVRTASDTSNEDRKTDIEEQKATASGAVRARSATEAADAIQRYAEKAATISDRATPTGKGEVADAREEAINKYAAHLVAAGEASQRNARQAATEYLESRGDVARGLSADVALRARVKTLRGDAVRANAAHAAGLAPGSESAEEGTPE